MRELDQVIGDLSVFRRQARLIAIARDADPEGQARQLDTASTWKVDHYGSGSAFLASMFGTTTSGAG